jgi:hypothetical protein
MLAGPSNAFGGPSVLDYPILLDPALNFHTLRATWLNADVVDGAEPGAAVGVLARQVDLLQLTVLDQVSGIAMNRSLNDGSKNK